MLPKLILRDLKLVTGLPVPIRVTSGLNSMVCATKAFYAPEGTDNADTLAVAGPAPIVERLPVVIRDPPPRGPIFCRPWACDNVVSAGPPRVIGSSELHEGLAHHSR